MMMMMIIITTVSMFMVLSLCHQILMLPQITRLVLMPFRGRGREGRGRETKERGREGGKGNGGKVIDSDAQLEQGRRLAKAGPDNICKKNMA